jgi:hypothetical protein
MPAIVLSDHAIERYQERVRPGLDRQAALEDLRHTLTSAGVWSLEAPDWLDTQHGDGFVLLGDDVALPIQAAPDGALVATTCLTRGGMDDGRRDVRKARKAKLRAQRAERRRLRNLPRTARPRAA